MFKSRGIMGRLFSWGKGVYEEAGCVVMVCLESERASWYAVMFGVSLVGFGSASSSCYGSDG